MKHFMICVSGYSRVGKDETCKNLIEKYNAVQTGLADPAKRHMLDLYGFTEQQLFGPSQFRNAGDLRYPKADFYKYKLYRLGAIDELPNDIIDEFKSVFVGELKFDVVYWCSTARDLSGYPYSPLKLGNSTSYIEEGDPRFWLSPRECLQQYCEKMNDLYLCTWVQKGVDIQIKIVENLENCVYSKVHGIVSKKSGKDRNGDIFTCFSDFRHVHEIAYVRQNCSTFIPVVVRVKNPLVPEPPYDHRSEVEQSKIPDEYFDFIINNDGTLEELSQKVSSMVDSIQNPNWKPKLDMIPTL